MQIAVHAAHRDLATPVALASAITRSVEMIAWALLTLGLTFLHDDFEQHRNVHVPGAVEVASSSSGTTGRRR